MESEGACPSACGNAPVGQVWTERSRAVLEAIAGRNSEAATLALADLSALTTGMTKNSAGSDAVALVWAATAQALDAALSPQACTDALLALASLAQLCTRCGVPCFDDWRAVSLGDVAAKMAACMQRHADSLTVQAAGCSLAAHLAGCPMCECSHGAAVAEALAAAGCVEAVAAAAAGFRSHCPSEAAQWGAKEALAALRFMTVDHADNANRLATAGGTAVVQHAVAAAEGDPAARAHALLLLGALACLPAALPAQCHAAAAAVWAAGAEAAPLQVTAAAVCSMARIAQAVLTRGLAISADPAASLAHGAGSVLASLQGCSSMDTSLVKHCLDYITLCAAAHQQPVAGPALSLLASPSGTALLARVAGQATQLRTRGSALRTLFYLSRCSGPKPTTGTTAVVLACMAGSRACRQPQDLPCVLGIQVYGLASLAAMRAPIATAHAQAAVAMACTLLADPAMAGLLSDCEPLSEPLSNGQQPVAWAALEAGVLCCAALLSAAGGPGINAADADGFALLHHLAMAGLHRGVAALLASEGGCGVDLLLRTRSGANALQLARQGRHEACASLLEGAAHAAAEARQAELLQELEAHQVGGCPSSSGDASSGRKGKKKKSMTRSGSFLAEQPDEKSQRMDAGTEAAEVAAAAAGAEVQRQAEERLRRQLKEEAYECALQQRRDELAEQRRAAEQAAVEEVRAIAAAAQEAREAQAAGEGTSGMFPPSPDHRPSTPDGPGQLDGTARDGGAMTSSSSDTDGSNDMLQEMPAQQQPPSQQQQQMQQQQQQPVHPASASAAATYSVLTAFGAHEVCQAVSSSGVDSPLRAPAQHSLFGSPSITGDLFMGSHPASPAATTSLALPPSPFPPTAALHPTPLGPRPLGSAPTSYEGSPLMGLPPLPLAPSRPNPGAMSARLQDALFVHDGPLSALQLVAPAVPTQREPSLLSSLSSGMSGMGSGSLFHPPAPLAGGAQRSSSGGSSPGSHPSSSLFAPLPPGRQSPSEGGSSCSEGAQRGADLSSDESGEPTRHLWIGNLGTRTPRAVLKSIFERHGVVDDVVTFPGRMYAFVNYRTTEEAVRACEALQEQVVPDLTGDRRLLLKYRPVKKAAAHLRALGLAPGDSAAGSGSGSEDLDLVEGPQVRGCPGGEVDRDGNCSDPSPRIWLGNIAPTASSKVLQAVLGRYGPLTDAAVFPARIGPLGYAFVKFERVEDAVAAFEGLNNTVVPPLSGSKQLKMRYKPATDGPTGRDDPSEGCKSTSTPSRHLWLGNVTQKPADDVILDVFGRYGAVDSVRVFPAKAYAFVNYAEVGPAVAAMAELDGLPVPALTGVKALVMRYQHESHPAVRAGAPALPLPLQAPMHRVRSESALALAAQLSQLVPGAGGALGGFGPPQEQLATGLGAGAPPPAFDDHTWRPEALGRSQSFGFLGVAPLGGGPAAAAAALAAANASSAAQYTSLLGISRQGSMSVDEATLQRVQSAGPSLMGGQPQPPQPQISTPAAKLSAVLQNLAALQRAASFSAHPPPPPPHLMQLNMLQEQADRGVMQGGQHGADIARLTSMLASQSLTTAPPPPMHMPPPRTYSPQAGGVPDQLLCPLSGLLLTDPVLAADGATYNRTAISEWMAASGTSPVTQAPLAHAMLVPNEAAKAAVMNFLRSQVGV